MLLFGEGGSRDSLQHIKREWKIGIPSAISLIWISDIWLEQSSCKTWLKTED